jgi:hypothetical protein
MYIFDTLVIWYSWMTIFFVWMMFKVLACSCKCSSYLSSPFLVVEVILSFKILRFACVSLLVLPIFFRGLLLVFECSADVFSRLQQLCTPLVVFVLSLVPFTCLVIYENLTLYCIWFQNHISQVIFLLLTYVLSSMNHTTVKRNSEDSKT